MAKRDKLFILRPGFENPEYPGKKFYCWHCVLIEGILASFPNLAEQIDVEHIAWPKPRNPLINLVGEDHQSVPMLVFGERPSQQIVVKDYNGLLFTDSKDEILKAFAVMYGVPYPHP